MLSKLAQREHSLRVAALAVRIKQTDFFLFNIDTKDY